jgi:hypothetical protein
MLLSSDTENPPLKPFANRRVTQIFEKPEFYVDGTGFSDVTQGKFMINLIILSTISDCL